MTLYAVSFANVRSAFSCHAYITPLSLSECTETLLVQVVKHSKEKRENVNPTQRWSPSRDYLKVQSLHVQMPESQRVFVGATTNPLFCDSTHTQKYMVLHVTGLDRPLPSRGTRSSLFDDAG